MKLHRLFGWHIDEIEDQIEVQFAQELLRSERTRAAIMCAVFAMGTVLVAVIPVAMQEEYEQIFKGKYPFNSLLLLFAGSALYELGARYVMGWFIRNGRTMPEIARYGNALLESLIPTIALFIGAEALIPVHSLLGPASVAYFLLITLSILRLNPWLCLFTSVVSGIGYSVLAVHLIERSIPLIGENFLTRPLIHLDKAFMMVIAGCVAAFVAAQVKRRLFHTYALVEERGKLVNLFSQQVSQAIVDEMIAKNFRIESARRNVCVMFLDIRNFTPFAEHRSPEEVVAFLNTLFDVMISVIHRHHGIINQFVGDGFMATFGAPFSAGNDCANALNAAQEIIANVEKLVNHGTIPPTRIGIGLHTGEAVTGNVGSAERQQYSITGNVVILASRIEQLNKIYDSQLLLSEQVLQQAGANGIGKSLGHVQVKGHQAPIHIYQVV